MKVDRMQLKEMLMDQWSDLREEAAEQWDEITDHDLDDIKGKYDKLVSKVEEKYNITHSQAQDQVDEFLASYYIMEE